MFKKLPDIMGISDVALDEYDTRMNNWDEEPKKCMLSAKKHSPYKDGHIEWIPNINIWLGRR